MKTCLLVNRDAGGSSESESALRRLAADSDTPVIVLPRWQPGDGQWLRRSCRHCERVLVSGGDGTLSRLINDAGDWFHDLQWALLPTGTGNDLARSLGLHGHPIEQVWCWAIENPCQPIDVIRVENGHRQWLLNAATAGFGDMVGSEITGQDKQHWGVSAYWIKAFTRLTALETFHVTLEYQEQREQLMLLGLVVANGRYVGGGFPAAPSARVDDGLLDVTAVGEMSTVEALAAGIQLTLGRPRQTDKVHTFRAPRVHVEADPVLPYSMDGEPSRRLAVTFEVHPQKLWIVPGPSPPAMAAWP